MLVDHMFKLGPDVLLHELLGHEELGADGAAPPESTRARVS